MRQHKRCFTSFINQHGAFLELYDILTILIFYMFTKLHAYNSDISGMS